MSHYDLTPLILGCLLALVAFGSVACLLASCSWRQADQQSLETFDEIKWDGSALMQHCPQCQHEREQVL